VGQHKLLKTKSLRKKKGAVKMATNKEIIEKNLEEEDYRVEFRIKYKYYKLLEKKLELEKNNKSEYIRELIIKDLKKIVKGDESTSKITQDFELVRKFVDETSILLIKFFHLYLFQ